MTEIFDGQGPIYLTVYSADSLGTLIVVVGSVDRLIKFSFGRLEVNENMALRMKIRLSSKDVYGHVQLLSASLLRGEPCSHARVSKA